MLLSALAFWSGVAALSIVADDKSESTIAIMAAVIYLLNATGLVWVWRRG
jgi:hypothetical protein